MGIFEAEVSVKSKTSDGVKTSFFAFGDGSGWYSMFSGSHIYRDTGTYQIAQYMTNLFGCPGSASDEIRVFPEFRCWVPDAFTPDGNSLNDRFTPVMAGVSHYSFQIFDRWGARIFHSVTPGEGWNGRYSGDDCPQGIYAWKLSFSNIETGSTETRLGHVMLLRNP
jgi:gliding motility-associated-like protein